MESDDKFLLGIADLLRAESTGQSFSSYSLLFLLLLLHFSITLPPSIPSSFTTTSFFFYQHSAMIYSIHSSSELSQMSFRISYSTFLHQQILFSLFVSYFFLLPLHFHLSFLSPFCSSLSLTLILSLSCIYPYIIYLHTYIYLPSLLLSLTDTCSSFSVHTPPTEV